MLVVTYLKDNIFFNCLYLFFLPFFQVFLPHSFLFELKIDGSLVSTKST